MGRSFYLCAALLLGMGLNLTQVFGQTQPSDPAVVVPEKPDDLGRDADSMTVDANANQRPGFGDMGINVTNDSAVVQGPAPSKLPEELLTESTTTVYPSKKSSVALLGGFAVAEFTGIVYDDGEYDLTFIPREVELDIENRFLEFGRLRLDLNLGLEWPKSKIVAFSSDMSSTDLFDTFIEQAFIEWARFGLTLRAGKMNIPFGIEPIDPIDRVALSRSSMSMQALPELLTGVYAGYAATSQFEPYLLAVNGWDVTVDGRPSSIGNRSKTVGAGLPHRFGKMACGHFRYSGQLAGLFGVEQKDINNARWLLDYSGEVRFSGLVKLGIEGLYAEEKGLGLNKSGETPRTLVAKWWAAKAAVTLDGKAAANSHLAKSRISLRIEYVHDDDLTLDLAHMPNIETLLGTAISGRYELVPGIDAGLEYRLDLERRRISGDKIPKIGWDLRDWYAVSQVSLALIGHF